MSTTSHTHRHWVADSLGVWEGDTLVAVIWRENNSNCPDFETAQNNGKLIAAAPDMLEALHAAYEHLHYIGFGDRWERECAVASGLESKIKSAIAKAEGTNQ